MAICGLGMTAAAQFSYMGPYDSNGKPTYLVNPGDVVSQAFKNRVENSLPEYFSVPVYHPEYLANTPTDLRITHTSDVWITYITEGASYRNSLGYYTYPTANPPATPPSNSDVKIILPNASNTGFGGAMNAGDKVFLGQFTAGTSIGWVLVSDGWNGTNVDNGRWILYSTPAYNPESDPSLKRHNVQLLDTATNMLVIGFEDNRRDSADCDHDFNDLLFYVRVNPFHGADTTRVPYIIDTAGNSSGGNNGGLESESLGDRLVKRSYQRLKEGRSDFAYNAANEYKGRRLVSMPGTAARNGRSSATPDISTFVPASLAGGFTPHETTPKDLVGLTRAVDVFAIDFLKNNASKATVLALETRDRPYSHTKSICDRFRGAQLVALDSIRVRGYNLIRFTLRQAGGSIEYATAFVAGFQAGRSHTSLQTNWLLSEIQPEDTMYNFQIWSSTPHHTIKLAEELIARLQAYRPLVQTNTQLTLPKAYVTLGTRDKNKLKVFVQPLAPGTMELKFEYRNSETDNTHLLTAPVHAPFGKGYVSEIVVNEGYEFDGALYLNGVKQDMVYLTDGGWGHEVDRNYSSILKYEVLSNSGRIYRDDEYALYRTASIKVNSSDYVSLFKMLAAGSEPVNMSAYKSLQFFAKGNTQIEVVLAKKGITDWKNQYRKTIQLTPAGNLFQLSLEDFVSKAAPDQMIEAGDLQNVTFTAIINSGNVRREVEFSIGDMAFSKKAVLSDRSLNGKTIEVSPNPARDRMVVLLNSDANRSAVINLTDMNGKVIHTQNVQLFRGENQIPVRMQRNASGRRQAIVQVLSADARYESRVIILE